MERTGLIRHLRRRPSNPLAGIRRLLALNKKKAPPDGRGLFLSVAERTGLEPATPGVTGRYSNQLNYHSKLVGADGIEPPTLAL